MRDEDDITPATSGGEMRLSRANVRDEITRVQRKIGAAICILMFAAALSGLAQDGPAGPTNEKAQKTYQNALKLLQKHSYAFAIDEFKKADKQDGGHCEDCQRKIVRYAIQLQDWKTAQKAAEEMLGQASTPAEQAIEHYQLGMVFLNEGVEKHKAELFSRTHDEMGKALTVSPNFSNALYADGRALAHLKQDDAAKARFEEFVKARQEGDLDRRRALRFIAEPELARARMAPPFEVRTIDGKTVAMDDLTGKVVLLDFWATWCAPCREALPHMKQIAKKFEGQPLVVLSVSLDDDEKKWKEFVAKNEMGWLQCWDGAFTGPIATMFSVKAIPQTFTIDSDGVLQDQHIGDASIEGKLKKLVARAAELTGNEKPLR